MAVFESKRTANGTTTANKNKRSCRQRSGKLREKIEIFEQGYDSISSLKLKSEKPFRLEKELSLVDLMSRKCSLMESFRRQPSHGQLTVSSLTRSLHDSLAHLDSSLLADLTPVPVRRGGRRPKHMRRASTGFLGVGVGRREDLPRGLLTETSQNESPAGPCERPRLERRASTGRLCFAEEPHTIWEFTNTYATPILSSPQDFRENVYEKAPKALPVRQNSQEHCYVTCNVPNSSHDAFDINIKDDEGEETLSAPSTRRGLLRRHSTGCLSSDSQDETVASTDTFWHVYEQADSIPPEQSLRGRYYRRRRRTVRFDQHVTVWVFPKDARDSPANLPQFFKRRTSGFGRAPKIPRRSRRNLVEDRFSSSGGTGHNVLSPPSMPMRKDNSIHCTVSRKEDLQERSPSPVALAAKEFSHNDKQTTSAVAPPKLPCRRPSSHSPPTRPERNFSAHSQISVIDASTPTSHDSMHTKDTTSWHSALTFDVEDSDSEDSLVSSQDLNGDDSSVPSEDSSVPGKEFSSGAPIDDDVLDKRHLFQLLASQKKKESSCQEQTPLQQRRERAIMWHFRFAMPTYKMMKYQVQNTPGLGITPEDVDWLFENANR